MEPRVAGRYNPGGVEAEQAPVPATQRLARATRRLAAATGRAVRMGLRVTLTATGGLLMVTGLMLVHPVGFPVLGLPLFALGFMLACKGVFW